MPVIFNSKTEEVRGSTLNLISTDDKPECSWTFQTSAWRTRAAAVFLGLLCLLLVLTFTLIAQSLLVRSYQDQLRMSRLKNENLTSEQIQLQTNLIDLSESRNQLETKFKSVTGERDALRKETEQMNINVNSLLDNRDQLQTSFSSLTKERDTLRQQTQQLKVNVKNLLGSTDQLENKFKSLTKERDTLRYQTEQLKVNVNSLSETRDQLQTSFSSLTKERDTLRNQTEQLKMNVNNLSETRDRLQTNFSSLTEERDALRNQTEQLKINAVNMSESRNQLQTELNSMTEERDTLRNETEQLKITAGNVSEEMKLLQSQYNSVAATRDALQSQVTELKGNVQLQLQLCKQQWVRFNNKCYYFSAKGEEKNWRNSKQDCARRGGRLAIVTTKLVLDFICNFYVETWIGLSDSAHEGRWKWVDGTDLVGNGFWLAGEPNDFSNNEDCVHTHKIGNNPGGWNDHNCNMVFSYVCEA